MFIIFGIKYLFAVVSSGTFACPRCDVDCPYQLKVPKKWFSLFWIPVFPLGTGGENFVECQVCKSQWNEVVLSRPTSAQFSLMLSLGVRASIVHVLRAGGTLPSESDLESAYDAVRVNVGQEYTQAQLRGDLAAFTPGAVDQYIPPLNERLNVQGKESIVFRLFIAAIPLEDATDGHLAAVAEVAALLGLSQAHTNGIAADALGTLRAAEDTTPDST